MMDELIELTSDEYEFIIQVSDLMDSEKFEKLISLLSEEACGAVICGAIEKMAELKHLDVKEFSKKIYRLLLFNN